MEFWYYIIEDGKAKRVTFETYKGYNGEKYITPCNQGAKFLCELLRSYL